jgi:hypothetical protein
MYPHTSSLHNTTTPIQILYNVTDRTFLLGGPLCMSLQPLHMTDKIQGGSHTKRVNTTNYELIDLEPNEEYLYQPTRGLGAGSCSIWHWPGTGSSIGVVDHYRKPCLYRDRKGGLHFPERGIMKCDGDSMMIYDDTPTPKGGSDAWSNHPAGSERPLKDNIWNRSFHGHPGARTIAEEWGCGVAGTAAALCKTTKSLVKSCFDKSRKTQSKRESVSAISASHDSTSSSELVKQVKSDQVPEGGWDRDGPVFKGWMGESKHPDRKSGSPYEVGE